MTIHVQLVGGEEYLHPSRRGPSWAHGPGVFHPAPTPTRRERALAWLKLVKGPDWWPDP